MNLFQVIGLFVVALLVSCASETKPQETAAPAHTSLSDRLNQSSGFKQDASGNWVPTNTKRSSFDGNAQTYDSKKTYKKESYKTGDYAKKSWWGSKEYQRQSYTGNTNGSRFQTTSQLQGQGAREATTTAKIPDSYQTENYQTSSAREAGNPAIAKPTNAAIDNRQKVFLHPEIIDWREQRRLSMEESKGILGR